MGAKSEVERVRGFWEKVPGSGEWWIRYRTEAGQLKREKVGRRSGAIALLNKRRNERRFGHKLPDNLRAAGIRFNALANDIVIAPEAKSPAPHRVGASDTARRLPWAIQAGVIPAL